MRGRRVVVFQRCKSFFFPFVFKSDLKKKISVFIVNKHKKKLMFPILDQLDASTLTLQPPETKNGRMSAALKLNNKAPYFNLCCSRDAPVRCRYRLDSVRENEDGARRGLTVELQPSQIAALEAFDKRVIQMVAAQSKAFFKKDLSEAEIRERYEPLVRVRENGEKLLKFKIKTTGYATKLYLDQETPAELSVLENDCEVVPILSMPLVWVMGSRFGVCLQAEAMIVYPSERDVFEGFAP